MRSEGEYRVLVAGWPRKFPCRVYWRSGRKTGLLLPTVPVWVSDVDVRVLAGVVGHVSWVWPPLEFVVLLSRQLLVLLLSNFKSGRWSLGVESTFPRKGERDIKHYGVLWLSHDYKVMLILTPVDRLFLDYDSKFLQFLTQNLCSWYRTLLCTRPSAVFFPLGLLPPCPDCPTLLLRPKGTSDKSGFQGVRSPSSPLGRRTSPLMVRSYPGSDVLNQRRRDYPTGLVVSLRLINVPPSPTIRC